MNKLTTILIVVALLPIPLLGQTQTRQGIVKVTTLIENRKINDAESLVAEHGLSLFIQRGGQTILFDTGASDSFIHNADRLGVDLRNVDIVVISHGHSDHAGGLPFFLEMNKKATVYVSKNAQKDLEFKNVLSDSTARGEDCQRLQFIDKPVQIAKDTYIFSGIEPNDFSLDYVDHEIILVSKVNNGLVLFTGCSHSGILNIVGRTRRTFPNAFIKAIFGGFHLSSLSFAEKDATKSRILVEVIGKQMLASPISRIYTGHCTGQRPYQILKGILGSRLEFMATGSKFFVF